MTTAPVKFSTEGARRSFTQRLLPRLAGGRARSERIMFIEEDQIPATMREHGLVLTSVKAVGNLHGRVYAVFQTKYR